MAKKRRRTDNPEEQETWRRQRFQTYDFNLFAFRVYNAKVSIRSRLYLISTIKSKLAYNEDRYAMFRNTVLEPWLDLKSEDHDNHVLNFMLQHQKHIENASFETPMYFEIDKHTLEFGRREFCLLTGLRFGKISLEHLEESVSGFCERVFPGFERIKGYDLIRVLHSESFNKMSNEDAVRLCMLLAVEYVLKGQELRHVLSNELLCLVDDFYESDAFSWGEYMWMEFHNRVYNVLSKKKEEHLLEFVKVGPSYKAHYSLYGFVFALKVAFSSLDVLV
ncbi:phospholipase-like protein [Artemisia annua]|uniref:Phospholipase-like protein n=1 Tax=Artemisia annua TaxID=35608 RepID=A0A2U1KGU7_ARTAN|nr:phospholipase-like protein [Artemisia annua]